MSKQRAETDGNGDETIARVMRALAERERQLRDLTEQALGFLEELAESRRLNGDRERLAERLGEVERALADARRRLRHAGGSAPTTARKDDAGRKPPALEIVFWGGQAHADAVASRPARGKVPASWVGLPDAVPADAGDKTLTSIVHRDARTPAQCWNLGMAATTADAVLFLGPGMRLGEPPRLPAAPPPHAALLCPLVDREGATEVGCEEADALLRLRPRPAPVDGDDWFQVPWPSPHAFVVRRAAFERVGLFDEGLLGAAALLDYALRARRANFAVLGLPRLAVAGQALPAPTAAEQAQADRERLVVLAAHRPERLGQALADLPLLWEMDRGELPGYLAQLLARLPASDSLEERRSVVERVAFGLVQNCLPASQLSATIHAHRLALLRGFAAAGLAAGGDEIAAALRRAEAQQPAAPSAALEQLAQDIALCRGATAAGAAILQQTRAERAEIDTQRHAQAARAERAEGARNLAQQQLEQVQQWLRDSQAELRQVHEGRHHALLKVEELHAAAAKVAEELRDARRGREQSERMLQERQRDQQQMERQLQESRQGREQLEKQLQESRQGREQLERQLQESRQGREQLERQLQESRQGREQLERQLQESRQGREQLEKQLQASERGREQVQRRIDEVVGRQRETEEKLQVTVEQHRELEREFLATDKSLRGVRQQVAEMARVVAIVGAPDRGDLQRRLAVLREEAQRLAATLPATSAADARSLLTNLVALGQQFADADRTIQERERWIGLLLQEVTKRRLFPRPLQEHERPLVDRVRRAP